MSAWPRESDATVAVEAAARKIYEISVANHREIAPTGTQFAEYDDLDPMLKLSYREAALPAVWAALSALPDPRHGAWEEGYAAGSSDGAFEAAGSGEDVVYPHENPYPSGL